MVLKVLGVPNELRSFLRSMDPAKISAIENMLPSTTVKQLQVFLGMANYYRKELEHLTTVIWPPSYFSPVQ